MTTDQTHSDHTYIVNEIVGSSPEGVDQAIRNGLAAALPEIAGLERRLNRSLASELPKALFRKSRTMDTPADRRSH